MEVEKQNYEILFGWGLVVLGDFMVQILNVGVINCCIKCIELKLVVEGMFFVF